MEFLWRKNEVFLSTNDHIAMVPLQGHGEIFINQNFAGFKNVEELKAIGWTPTTVSGTGVTFPGEYLSTASDGKAQISMDLTKTIVDGKESDFSIKLGRENAVYTFEYKMHAVSNGELNLFCLSGENFSLYFGDSWYEYPWGNVGSINKEWGAEGNEYPHSGSINQKLGATFVLEDEMPSFNVPLTYKMELTTRADGTNTIKYSSSDGTNKLTVNVNFESTEELNRLGFQFESNNVAENACGVYGLKASKSIPEPTTASLGIFGVTFLLLRRKRA